MQLKNLRLASKVWLLIAIMVLPLLAAGLWMTSYLLHIEKEGQEHVAAFEQRKLLVQGLRSNVELNASNFLALNMAPESERTFFEQRFQRTAQQAEDLTQQTDNALTTPEGKALFGKVKNARQGLYQAITDLQNARAAGESLMPVINGVMLPAIASYQGELDKLVQWQDKLLAASQVEYQQKKDQATWLGAAVLLVALMGGMAISTWLVRQITQPLQEAVTLAEHIERGDLTHQIQTDRQDEMGRLLSSLGAMAVRLRDVVGQVRSGVHAVSSASSEIATGSQELSSRTEQTAANLQETAASMEQLTSTLSQSADTARQANQLAVTAVHAAERGGVVVQEVVSSMQKINTASRKINDIIGVIDGIAFQTNILALNAAVEAARAGEQGRGFAVVAGEVRALAQRSAEAAKEIKHLISDSVNSVDAGSQQVDQAGQTMQEIVDSVRRVTDLIGEITASASEQRDGIGQVNQAVSTLDQMTQQNAALVEESSSAALSMHEHAKRLAQVVAIFKVEQQGLQGLSMDPAGYATPAVTNARATAVKAVTSRQVVPPVVPKPQVEPAAPRMAAPTAMVATPRAVAAKTMQRTPDTQSQGGDDWESF